MYLVREQLQKSNGIERIWNLHLVLWFRGEETLYCKVEHLLAVNVIWMVRKHEAVQQTLKIEWDWKLHVTTDLVLRLRGWNLILSSIDKTAVLKKKARPEAIFGTNYISWRRHIYSILILNSTISTVQYWAEVIIYKIINVMSIMIIGLTHLTRPGPVILRHDDAQTATIV